MGQDSSIEWTDHTFNPWWGCTKVSQGCKHCYAETIATRYGHGVWGPTSERRMFGANHWKEPQKWNQQASLENQRIRVFCASMADVFESNGNLEIERRRLWSLIANTPMLDWLLLTKRPENMMLMAPWKLRWPDNVWAMTSVEDQEQAHKRIPELIRVPAVVKGLSVEPLLGPVDLSRWLSEIQWVIVGGESGPSARPMRPEWVRHLRDQCIDAGVAFFFKQWGGWAPVEAGDPQTELSMMRLSKKAAGRLIDGMLWSQVPNLAKESMSLLAYPENHTQVVDLRDTHSLLLA